MFHPRLITPPATLPVTLAEARTHVRYEDSDQDALLTAQIGAAVAHLDGWSGVLGRCLITQVWEQPLAGWPACGIITLPFPDCTSVQAHWTDAVGDEQALTSTPFDSPVEAIRGTAVRLATDFSAPALADILAPLAVRFTAGYGTAADDVPPALRQAILLIVGDLFRFRETAGGGTISALPVYATVSALLAPYRRVLL